MEPGRAMNVENESEKLHIMVPPLSAESAFGEHVYCAAFVSDVHSNSSGWEQYLRDLYALTPREAEIACLLIQGYSATEAADICGVMPSTVMTHKKRIFNKRVSPAKPSWFGSGCP